MMRNLRNTWRPEAYHGCGKKGPFFEGWYFKLVDAAGSHAYAVIPGVFVGEDAAESHSFVQTLDGLTGHSTYHRYPLAAFNPAPDRFDLRVGPNRFTRESLSLDLAFPDREIAASCALRGGRAGRSRLSRRASWAGMRSRPSWSAITAC